MNGEVEVESLMELDSILALPEDRADPRLRIIVKGLYFWRV